ncbi:MAG: S9 family peptidase [Ideonella sp.]
MRSLSGLRLGAAFFCCSLVLAACSPNPIQPSSAARHIEPNSNLRLQGIPPLPLQIADEVARYTDFRGHRFVDWHPLRREMLVAHRKSGGNTTQLFRIASPLAEAEQLTDSADPVSSASYEPRDGRFIVFARSSGGNEAAQLFRLDPDTRATIQLTDPAERHELQAWLHASAMMVVGSLPLDKTAAGGKRAKVVTRIRLVDPLHPEAARLIAELDGGGWYAGAVSRDDRRIAMIRYLSANESQVWMLELASGQITQLLPQAGTAEKASFFAGAFSADDQSLFVVSDRFSEFRELLRYDFGANTLTRVTANIPWDISGLTTTADAGLVAAQANVDGRDELRLFDGLTLAELPAPKLPAGSIGSTQFHRRLPDLAFSIDGSQGPSQLYSINALTGKLEQWTRAETPPGVDPSRFGEQQIIRWPSFDGRTISGLLNLPPPRFSGKRPVLVQIHGGPESQAKVGFMGRYNFLLDELGIAVIQPNARGSSGYGKTFVALDDGRLREDSVKDIGALFDWIAAQPGLDASRVMVSGGSYGGYMSLAVSTHYADRIAGAIDVVGISNFVSFLNNTESYRRDLRRVEYGDERDPAMRDFLERISPLTQADRITKPLFVVQGKNDPRVPYTEAEQIVAKLRDKGVPVWYLRAENEGHGFARKENADFQFYAMVEFMRRNLLK